MVYDSEEILTDSTLERLKASKIKKKKKVLDSLSAQTVYWIWNAENRLS